MIRVPEVRVIDADGTSSACSRGTTPSPGRASGSSISSRSPPPPVPPVCRIMDFGKFKYEQKKKQQKSRCEAARDPGEGNPLPPEDRRSRHGHEEPQARGFLEEGNKVQVTVPLPRARGDPPEIAQTMLQDFASRLSEVGKVERFPKLEGKQMVMILTPLKMPAS